MSRKARRLWRRAVALFVMFSMVFSDVAPLASAVYAEDERILSCELPEHVHDDSCYQDVLIWMVKMLQILR